MSLLTLDPDHGDLRFDEAQCRAAGRALAAGYRAASPFPHVVIDDFLDPALLRRAAAGFPAADGKAHFDRDQERLKYQFAPDEIGDALLRSLLLALNTPPLLAFLEEMTGIKGLISDPYYLGGGLHETRRGGHLSVHADFNIHRAMRVERRLNLLIYLNEDWPADWRGALELWDRKMRRAEVTVAPLLGRAVIFNTDADSFHGHPDPLACPPDRARRSIATYYYTAPDPARAAPSRTTNFRARPGTDDRPDRRNGVENFIRAWVPARLQPLARRLNRFR